MKKVAKMLAAIGLTGVALCNMTGCTSLEELILGPIIKSFLDGLPPMDWHVPTFEERCVTTEDGFTYYVDSNDGLCIIDLPDMEEVAIPEYIDGQRVMQLGYEEKGLFYGNTYWLDGQHVNSLIIQHSFKYQYTTSFNALQKITYVDFPYCKVNMGGNEEWTEIRISNGITINSTSTIVELKKSDRSLDLQLFYFSSIFIPRYVMLIESGVFDGLEGVTIRTSYESKPDGWEEGWNGNCLVEWGCVDE